MSEPIGSQTQYVESRVGTTREERAELREVMAILHRVKLRLAYAGSVANVELPTEVRLVDEAIDRIGSVVAPRTVRDA